jgi:hypothetical protein
MFLQLNNIGVDTANMAIHAHAAFEVFHKALTNDILNYLINLVKYHPAPKRKNRHITAITQYSI